MQPTHDDGSCGWQRISLTTRALYKYRLTAHDGILPTSSMCRRPRTASVAGFYIISTSTSASSTPHGAYFSLTAELFDVSSLARLQVVSSIGYLNSHVVAWSFMARSCRRPPRHPDMSPVRVGVYFRSAWFQLALATCRVNTHSIIDLRICRRFPRCLHHDVDYLDSPVHLELAASTSAWL